MGLKQVKERVYQDRGPERKKRLPNPAIPGPKYFTPSKVTIPEITIEHREAMDKAVTTEEMSEALPMGYHAIGKNDIAKLMALKAKIEVKLETAFDYETNGDPDDDTQDPQDHTIVGVSFACEIGQAFYLPINHVSYGANWDIEWLVDNFLKPILEHPDITIIAHNIQAEHAWSLCLGIDMFPKTENRKIIDTMILVKQLALAENIGPTGDMQVGCKPATKALLADENGMVHGLLHIDDIKSFKETIGKKDVPIPGEFYKSGAKKGQPKTKAVSRTFNELPVDKGTVDYGASDSDWSLGLKQKLMPILYAEGLDEVFFELNVPFCMVLAEYELTGWHANRERLEAMGRTAEKALYGDNGTEADPEEGSIMFALNKALVDLVVNQTTLNENGEVMVPEGRYHMGQHYGEDVYLHIKNSAPFNWGSVQHKQWLFFHVLGIDTRGLERSKTTRLPSTGKANWDKMVDGYEGDSQFMKILKEKNKFDKIVSTYVNGMLPFLRQDTGKIHTHLKLVSTWRLSSGKPNLQNIPRADNDPLGIRNVFEAPDYDPKASYTHLNVCTQPTVLLTREGLRGQMVYVNADYSQIELRVLAWYAQERNMIQAFWDGHDFHSATAHDIFELACTIEEVKNLFKPQRYGAKSINFGLVYGLTEYGLSKDPKLNMSVTEAKAFIDKYFTKYPGVKDYANGQIAFARENGYVQTIFGNRRPIPDINHPNKWIRQSAENKAMNTPIQGGASDIIRLAMVNLRKETAKPENSYLKCVMQIHDEIQGECPIEYAVRGAMLLKEVMEQPVPGLDGVIPIIAEPAIGKIWGHALDLKFDDKGNPYVKAKKVKKEATDVTIDEIEYMLELYHIAGIEVKIS